MSGTFKPGSMSTADWPGLLPPIVSRNLIINDLDVHILEAKPAVTTPSPSPLVILLHGFPEIAYSWRKVLIPLSEAGYHVVAPDQRGYGRTKRRTQQGSHDRLHFEDDLSPFRMLNLAADVVALTYALGYQSAAAVVGHDYGSIVAGHCALMRPDLFGSVVMMSAPYTGTPPLSLDRDPPVESLIQSLNRQLVNLEPPRKHYTMYYSTADANEDMVNAPQGLHAFLRAYYHVKSRDWAPNKPYPLPSLSAVSFSQLPYYYVMLLQETMAQTVEPEMPSLSEIQGNTWLTEAELAVYTSEYTATGFQGGLNRYRCMTDIQWSKDLAVFSGKRIEVPAMFIAGKQDWGVYQHPGAEELMRRKICAKMEETDFVLVEGAGHWVQQEAPGAVVEHLLLFLKKQ